MEIKVIENQNEIYIKDKLLGQGAFGKAYLVKHKQTQESLVIKQMNIEHMSAKEKEQTVKQAQILKNLNHPNIVLFKEVYITKNNKLKIVMEYAECGDLAKAISARKAKKQYFDQKQILDWFTQICLAIKHVHDRKILHRDIKGQNIFIAKNNSLKLGDFGIARVLNKTMQKARTVVGTPYYLSPEIIQNKPYSFQSDIWSIGAVLYEMCALQPPFTAASLQMLALKIVKGSYPAISGNYSKQLKGLIAQMLTLNPSKRPNINQILKKSIIQDRIRQFLTETKRIAEFSHTVLHNQRVQIFTNKLVQIKQQKMQSKEKQEVSKQKDAVSYEKQRQKLKEDQNKMEAILKRKEDEKKRQLERKRQQQEKRKQEDAQRRDYDSKKREAQKKWQDQERRKWVEKEKQREKERAQKARENQYEQNRRIAQMVKNRRNQEQKDYQRQMQINHLMMQKQQIQERAKQQMNQKKRRGKKLDEEKKKQDFNDAARQQFFENQQIRKRAQQRARQDQQSYYSEPAISDEPQTKNYHYQNKKPESRPSSRENKVNKSDYNQRNHIKHEPSLDQLENAYLNPNFNKKSKDVEKKSSERRPGSQQQNKRNSGNQAQEQQAKLDSRKKIQQTREQMKKDRQKFMKGKNTQSPDANYINQDEIQDIKDKTKIGKWGNKKNSKNNSSEEEHKQSPRFLKEESETDQESSPLKAQHGFNSLIRDSDNLFLEPHDPAQFGKYVEELEGILNDVQKKLELLPQFPLQEQVVFREDDQLQFSLTAINSPINIGREEEQIETDDADFEYFSNFSKLQTLRIQLQEAFGLQNFIRLYRYIESQVNQHGLQSFNIVEAISQAGGDIDSKVLKKNLTLLLTLVTLQQNMNQN